MKGRLGASKRRRFGRISLQAALLIPLLGLIVLAVTLVGSLSYRAGQQAVYQVAGQLSSEINARIGEHLRAFLDIPRHINQFNVQILSQNLIDANDQTALEKHFLRQVQSFESVTSINFGNQAGGLANAGREGAGGFLYLIGTEQFAAGPFHKYATDLEGNRTHLLETIPDFDARTRSWYEKAVEQGGEIWSEVYVLFTGQDLSLSASQPVYSDQQSLMGVTAVNFFLTHLSDYLAGIEVGQTGQSFIMERSGWLIATSTGERLLADPGEGVLPAMIQATESTTPLIRNTARLLTDQANLSSPHSFEFFLGDQRQFARATPYQDPAGLDWLIVTIIPEKDFMALIDDQNRKTILLMIGTLLAVLGAGLLITRRLVRPISQLNQAAGQLAQGLWPDFAQLTSRIGEIDDLSRSFRHMASRLREVLAGLTREIEQRRQREEQLRESEDRFRSFAELAPVGVVISDEREQVLSVNQTFTELFGYTREDLPSVEALWELAPPRPTGTPPREGNDPLRKEAQTAWGKVFAAARAGSLNHPVEFPVTCQDGTIRDVEFRLTSTGRLNLIVLIDVTQRRASEKALLESEKKLDSFFSQSLAGCFFMMLDQPVAWSELTDQEKESALEYIMTHQRMTKVNQALLDQYRAREEDVLGLTPHDLFQHDLTHGRTIWKGLFNQGHWHVETSERRRDGTPMWVEGDYICLYDDRGHITGHFGVQTDITEKKRIQQALQKSEEKFRRIAANIEDILYSVDARTREFSYLSPAFEKILGFRPEDVQRMGGRTAFMSSVLQGDTFSGQTTFLDSLQSEKPARGPFHHEAWWRCRDGTLKYLEDIWTPVYEHGRLVSTDGVLRDITARKKTEEEIRYLSFHDSLTGLYNRTFLEEEMDRLDTARQLPLTIIMADVNGLKLVNDTYGHLQGDRLLQQAAGILKTCCRQEDIIARWGGDEFVILLPQTSESAARVIAQRIMTLCAEIPTNQVPVSMALGLATQTRQEKNLIPLPRRGARQGGVVDLLKEAEDLMYQQKLTESRSAKSAVLKTLLQTLAAKSYETEAHTRRMQEIGRKIGQKLNLSSVELSRLEVAITLHDIGKINLPEDLLTRNGSLTQEEWKLIKQHPEIGYRITRATEEFLYIAEDILSHHERWDGQGYPRGLAGESIPLLARITAIADAWEVMSNGRPYKQAMAKSEIIAEFQRCRGSQFDPDLVDLFLSVLGEGEG